MCVLLAEYLVGKEKMHRCPVSKRVRDGRIEADGVGNNEERQCRGHPDVKVLLQNDRLFHLQAMLPKMIKYHGVYVVDAITGDPVKGLNCHQPSKAEHKSGIQFVSEDCHCQEALTG